MKTPISYYGGKQNLISELLPLIPRHTQYVEPFIGGASLFFAKPPSSHEVINDYDLRVANFYDVLQNDFVRLKEKIKQTLHHEHIYRQTKAIMKEGCNDKLEYAWAFWVQTNMSFSNKLLAGFAFANDSSRVKQTGNKRMQFENVFYDRIKYVEIFNRDAIELIKMKDTPDTFMYLDPPYAESNCGHYEKGKDVYYRLLEVLPTLKCKWLMSSYPSEQLTNMRLQNGWISKDVDKNLSVSGNDNAGKRKTECLTRNYNLENQQQNLFAA